MSIVIVAIGGALIALQILLAYATGWLTPEQMIRTHQTFGVPYLYHFGALWGDIVLTILLAVIAERYSSRWTLKQVLVALMCALVISAGMHWQYAHDTLAGAHGGKGVLSTAGWVHAAYMVGALTMLALFYFCSRPHPRFAVVVSILLFAQLIVGTHTILKVWSPPWFPPMPVVDTTTGVVWAASTIVLVVLTWWTRMCYASRRI